MVDPNPRPGKRIRQACEPCRRKKTRCPGEKPRCSFCERLQQQCTYAEEPSTHNESQDWAGKLAQLDTKVNKIMSLLVSSSCTESTQDTAPPLDLQNNPAAGSSSSYEMAPPVSLESPSNLAESSGSYIIAPSQAPITPPELHNGHMVHYLPDHPLSHATVTAVIGLYLYHCHCQPLAVFRPAHLSKRIETYGRDLLFAIFAVALRFSDDPVFRGDKLKHSQQYADRSLSLVMSKVVEGRVELSTLQALCLLIFFDITAGHAHRAWINIGLGLYLSQTAQLEVDVASIISPGELEDRRNCFWAFRMLEMMCDSGTSMHVSLTGKCPSYPQSMPNLLYDITPESTSTQAREATLPDLGIVAYSIQVTEVWKESLQYSKARLDPTERPPWHSDSDYFKVQARILRFEAVFPHLHQFSAARFPDHDSQALRNNTGYWGPWLYVQFTYHLACCLLYHPFLIQEEIKSRQERFPNMFVDNCASLALLHSSWIDIFVTMVNDKDFPASDPFLAYCTTVAASIHLWYCYSKDQDVKGKARSRFLRGYEFIDRMAQNWPNAQTMANSLNQANRRASLWPLLNEAPFTPTDIPLVDKSLMWSLLTYTSRETEAGSEGRVFHESLDPNIVLKPSRLLEVDDGTDSAIVETSSAQIPPGQPFSTGPPFFPDNTPQNETDFFDVLNAVGSATSTFSGDGTGNIAVGEAFNGQNLNYGESFYDWSRLGSL